MMKVTIMHVSTLGNNEEHNNEQEHNTDEFSNIGSIKRNVRLPFLFNYNQKKPGNILKKIVKIYLKP